jgi:P pilus assembly chaperone PapD
LRIALRLGIPVFIPPPQPNSELRWDVAQTTHGDLRVALSNTGNQHIHIQNLTLYSPQGGSIATKVLATYLFAGKKEHWILHPKSPWQGESVLLSAHTDKGSISAKIKVNRP